jgi:RarD protein
VLLSINWLIYVWGVNSDFIVETSLGYFINPLLSVLLGVIFLRERLRQWQWVSVGLAAAGSSTHLCLRASAVVALAGAQLWAVWPRQESPH